MEFPILFIAPLWFLGPWAPLQLPPSLLTGVWLRAAAWGWRRCDTAILQAKQAWNERRRVSRGRYSSRQPEGEARPGSGRETLPDKSKLWDMLSGRITARETVRLKKKLLKTERREGIFIICFPAVEKKIPFKLLLIFPLYPWKTSPLRGPRRITPNSQLHLCCHGHQKYKEEIGLKNK